MSIYHQTLEEIKKTRLKYIDVKVLSTMVRLIYDCFLKKQTIIDLTIGDVLKKNKGTIKDKLKINTREISLNCYVKKYLKLYIKYLKENRYNDVDSYAAFLNKPLFPTKKNKKYGERLLGMHLRKFSTTAEEIRQARIRHETDKIKANPFPTLMSKRGYDKNTDYLRYDGVAEKSGLLRRQIKNIANGQIQVRQKGKAIINLREKLERYIERIERGEDIKPNLERELFTRKKEINGIIKEALKQSSINLFHIMSLKTPKNQKEIYFEISSLIEKVTSLPVSNEEKARQYKNYFFRILSYFRYYNTCNSDNPTKKNEDTKRNLAKQLTEKFSQINIVFNLRTDHVYKRDELENANIEELERINRYYEFNKREDFGIVFNYYRVYQKFEDKEEAKTSALRETASMFDISIGEVEYIIEGTEPG